MAKVWISLSFKQKQKKITLSTSLYVDNGLDSHPSQFCSTSRFNSAMHFFYGRIKPFNLHRPLNTSRRSRCVFLHLPCLQASSAVGFGENVNFPASPGHRANITFEARFSIFCGNQRLAFPIWICLQQQPATITEFS